jgi:uncharacterized protein YjbI with pentapeptide repeats
VLSRHIALAALVAAAWAAALVLAATASADRIINGCKIVSEPTARHHTHCAGADLQHAGLHNTDLSYAYLADADLSRADLRAARLERAHLLAPT